MNENLEIVKMAILTTLAIAEHNLQYIKQILLLFVELSSALIFQNHRGKTK